MFPYRKIRLLKKIHNNLVPLPLPPLSSPSKWSIIALSVSLPIPPSEGGVSVLTSKKQKAMTRTYLYIN